MPWITDQYDVKKYKPSIYAKEELPTWDEVFNEFFVLKKYVWYTGLTTVIDPYWKINRLKVLIPIVCNQFNKMIFEDGMKDKVITDINEKLDLPVNITGIRFTCNNIRSLYGLYPHNLDNGILQYISDLKEEINLYKDTPPPIYTIPMPNGKPNPFIISDNPRIDVTTLKDYISIIPVLEFFSGEDDEKMYGIWTYNFDDYVDNIDAAKQGLNRYAEILGIMLKPYADYFTNGIGWKSEDGSIIPIKGKQTMCVGSGVDPAK